MSFDKIYEKWTNTQNKSKDFNNIMEEWLENNPPKAKKTDINNSKKGTNQYKKSNLKRMKPQAELDLHGLTVKESITLLKDFILDCKNKDIKKILVIHGKGHHSSNGPVLKSKIREYLQSSKLIGETGIPTPVLGGDGAFWAIIR